MLLRSRQPLDPPSTSQRRVLGSKSYNNRKEDGGENGSSTSKKMKQKLSSSSHDISLYFDDQELSMVTRDDIDDVDQDKENSNVTVGSPNTPDNGFGQSNNIVTSTPLSRVQQVTRNLLSYMKAPPKRVTQHEPTERDIVGFQQRNTKTYAGRIFTVKKGRRRKRRKAEERIECVEEESDNEEEEEPEEKENCPQSPRKKKKMTVTENKAFVEWAEKMNREIGLAESFELVVE